MLYDLKQKQTHEPTGLDIPGYWNTVDEFLTSGWDETILNRFFRASRPLYTTQIYVPRLDASRGTIAFGVDKIVKPNEYVIHYKGQVSPPEDGTYRFVGLADNFIAVSVNGDTEMFSNWAWPNLPKLNWHPPSTQSLPVYEHAKTLQNGRWFTAKAGDVIDLDVLMGEADGGASSYFLMIEKQGAVYPKNEQGDPILPIFQVAPHETPHIASQLINYSGPDFSPAPHGNVCSNKARRLLVGVSLHHEEGIAVIVIIKWN